jgi:hypothetical protein
MLSVVGRPTCTNGEVHGVSPSRAAARCRDDRGSRFGDCPPAYFWTILRVKGWRCLGWGAPSLPPSPSNNVKPDAKASESSASVARGLQHLACNSGWHYSPAHPTSLIPYPSSLAAKKCATSDPRRAALSRHWLPPSPQSPVAGEALHYSHHEATRESQATPHHPWPWV